ncbi:MAG: hypothetical protein GY950_02680, partial [bacterium]|nr:hypothetical protein [bacterium]
MSKLKTTIFIICSLVLFIAGGILLERYRGFAPVKRAVRSPSVPSGLLNYGTLGKLLKQLGLVVAVPNDQRRYKSSGTPEPGISASLFRKKRHVSEYLFRINPGGYRTLPSSRAVTPEHLTAEFAELPVLSVVTAEENLYGKKGIITNVQGRGREWERFSYASYFDGGQLRFATAAGIRLHGGANRGKGETRSFRLYFRDEYGAGRFKPGILSGFGADPVKHLVVHNIMDWQVRYTPAVAFDIARQTGCRVPETRLVRFLLNGKPQGRYYLSEHLNKRQWMLSYIKHDNFAFYSYRGQNDPGTLDDYRKLEKWAADPKIKMTLEEAKKYVDVDNLSRHLFSWMFCNTTDQGQGVALLDKGQDRPRWYWINWDMDQSFFDSQWDFKGKSPWEKNAMELATGHYPPWMKNWVRPTLFRRLLKESPAYRGYFVRLVMDLLNHRLTPGFFKDMFLRYRALPVPRVEGVRLGYLKEPALQSCQPEVITVYDQALEALRKLGA